MLYTAIMKEFVFKGDTPVLLREHLRTRYPLLTAGGFSRAVKTKAVLVNGERALYNQKIRKGDTVRLHLPDAALGTAGDVPAFASGIALQVVFEDDALLVVNKPAGLLCLGDEADTLEKRCALYTQQTHGANAQPPRLCHRLDRGTSGLVILAKSEGAKESMLAQMQNGSVEKEYVCVCTAPPPKKKDTLHAFLTKNAKTATVKVTAAPTTPASRAIETRYRVLGEENGLYLLAVQLITGRTHQIRAHMAFIGCPLLGDSKYGDAALNRTHRAKYQALCARTLTFNFTAADAPLLKGIAGQTLHAPQPWFEKAFEEGTL